MKKMVMAAAAAVMAFAATPAMANDAANANFTGVRIGATAGIDDVTGAIDTNRIVYGVDAGYDLALGNRVVLGVEATVTNPFENSRTIGAAGRLGVAVTDNLMPYVRAGWSNYRDVTNIVDRNVDGLTIGGGVELALNRNVYAKAEYRYSDFAGGVGNHGGLVGVGLRF